MRKRSTYRRPVRERNPSAVRFFEEQIYGTWLLNRNAEKAERFDRSSHKHSRVVPVTGLQQTGFLC